MKFYFKFQNTDTKEWLASDKPFATTADDTAALMTTIDTEALDMHTEITENFITPLKACVTYDGNLNWVSHVYVESDYSGLVCIAHGVLNSTGFIVSIVPEINDDEHAELEKLMSEVIKYIPDVIIAAMAAAGKELSMSDAVREGLDSSKLDALINTITSKTKAEIVKPSETLDSYVCDSSLKEELLEVKDFFENSKTYRDLGIALPKGILFKGPPGTGKTYAARCIAGGVDCYFMTCTASALQGMYIGSGAENIRDVFKGAKMLREHSGKGVIIFIDELDSLGSRDSHRGNAGGEEDRTLNQLLAEMSGFEDCDGIMILAATNYPERLDDALMRSGRFSRQISIGVPEHDERRALVEFYFKKIALPLEDTDYENVTELTDGMTPADIKEMCNEAAILAVRDKSKTLTLSHINEAINRTITKNVRRPDTLDVKLVAAHECGHVLAEWLFNKTVPIKVTNFSYGDAGGFTQTSLKLTGILPKEKFLNQVRMLLAGRAAEEAIAGYVTNGASNDLSKAIRILNAYYKTYMFDKYEVAKLEQQVLEDVDKYYNEVLTTFREEATLKTLRELTDRLVASRVLYASDIIAIVSTKGDIDFL